jgi:hypothetical protein
MTVQVGQTLTATNGTWANSPTRFAYQWDRGGVPIPGATANTYVPVSADVGNVLTISVTGINGFGSSTPTISASTSAVIDIAPMVISVPTISGTVQVGQQLNAVPGVWTRNPAFFIYQWNRSGTAIASATASVYVPVEADVGNTLTVSVIAVNSGGQSLTAMSAATSAVIDVIPTNISSPTIFGTAQVGQTLTASTGTWANSPTSYAYQWNRAGTAIAGATASTYPIIAADVGNTLTVSVIARNSGGSSPAATSAATGAVIGIVPVDISVPTVTGTAQVGQQLTAATPGTWTNSPTSYTYQWLSGGINATGPGAATSTYTLVAADLGNTITVSVIASNGFGPSVVPATSAATAVVIDIAPTINTAASIPGVPQVGIPITPVDAIWNHSVVTRTYQWKVGGVNATGDGAQMQTYTPAPADAGSTLTVTVTATNTGGTSSPSTSAASAAVVGSGVGGKLDFSQAIDSPLITVIAA